MEEWSVEYWADDTGKEPVKEWLDELTVEQRIQ